MSILKIIKFEGLLSSEVELGCYIHLNNILQDIITPMNKDHPVLLPSEGEVKILVKEMNESSSLIASGSFSLTQNTPNEICIELKADSLSSIPLNLYLSLEPSPRTLSSQESPEMSVSDEEGECPRLKLQLKMQTFSLQEINLELQSAQNKLTNESKARQFAEGKLQEMAKEYSQFVTMAQNREKSMLKLLEQKDVEIAENINQTLKLQGYLDRLLEDKRHIEEKLACLKTVVSNDENELLRQQVTQLKSQLAQEEKRRQELQEMLLQIGKEWRETEDQEKLNIENKLIKTEQENIRANSAIQDLQLEVQRYQSTVEKNSIEVQLLRHELERSQHENAVSLEETQELKTKITEFSKSIELKEQEIDEMKVKFEVISQEKQNLEQSLDEKHKETQDLETEIKNSGEKYDELKERFDRLTEQLQEEKIYCDRLNSQILTERLNSEKCKKVSEGPGIDFIIEEVFKSLKLENSFLKVGESYFLDGLEVNLTKKIDYRVDAKIANSKDHPVPLSQFLTTPKPKLKKRISQDSRVESENEGISVYSIDKDRSMFCSEKVEKREVKNKSTSKPMISKVPLKEKIVRVGSTSVERKRPYK